MIPNFLTVFRIVIALIFPIAPPHLWLEILTLGLLTEFFDGALASKFNWVSVLGQILDPIADRFFALSVGLTLLSAGQLLPVQLFLIMIRDILGVIGLTYILFTYKNIFITTDFKPNFWGKTTTAFQYLVFYNALINTKPYWELVWITSVLGITALFRYAIRFVTKL